MDKKLVFFDIDGTLLDHEKKVPLSTKEAIDELKAGGHEAAIATGRPPFLFKELREELGIDSYVSLNGQYVVYQGKVVYSNPIPPEVLLSLKDYAQNYGQPIAFTSADNTKLNMIHHARVEASYTPHQLPIPECDPHYNLGRDIYQAALFCTEEEEVSYSEEYRDQLRFVRWDRVCVDVIPMGGSKAAGIEKFIQHTGFKREDVIAFGDNLNDLEMLQFVGHGVAMGNANPVVKEAARYVTRDVDQDGIMHGLCQLGLIASSSIVV
ncbi:Cof-type HAD-IIB family hydrolase [Paenibacillus faecalis]|uniref:Cof-type HAD-IIB family hydrolase n=1 Tax=Paenibacillus faecalis TaxID=2079532 RepID=UPI000D0EC54D|nr:Cof-type HAD-IIB family hydrolase [Paenibacillus faecalis]